jgi:hypothetical protein
MGGDADAEEERGKRCQQPVGVELGRRRRAEGDVAQMPGGVRRMEQRDEVAPAAGA